MCKVFMGKAWFCYQSQGTELCTSDALRRSGPCVVQPSLFLGCDILKIFLVGEHIDMKSKLFLMLYAAEL